MRVRAACRRIQRREQPGSAYMDVDRRDNTSGAGHSDMGTPCLSETEAAVRKHGGVVGAARALGLHPGTVRRRLAKEQQGRPTDRITQDFSDKSGSVTTVSATIKTVADALKKADVDRKLWAVDRFVVNSWEVGSKDPETGEVTVTPLWQVKVWLKLKTPSRLESALELLIQDAKAASPKYPPAPPSGPRRQDMETSLLELSIPDLHLGKLCWQPETGENYDVQIAVDVHGRAVEHMLRKARHHNITRVLFPVGNDLLHVDNQFGTTTMGTKQDADGRWQRMFRKARDMLIRSIELAAVVAPVDVIVVPGNHDEEMSFYLGTVLEAWFHNSKRVTIDNSPTSRKYYRYGNTLLGFTHGQDEKHADLKSVMVDERARDYTETLYRAWHLGHYHARRETRYNAGDTHGGVSVEILPSLSGTDAWHYGKGYVKSPKEARAYVYGHESGLTDTIIWRAPAGAYTQGGEP